MKYPIINRKKIAGKEFIRCGKFILETNLLINGAGLNAVKIANELHGEEKFANKFLKGEYYNYQGKEKLDHLIYPIPTKNINLRIF